MTTASNPAAFAAADAVALSQLQGDIASGGNIRAAESAYRYRRYAAGQANGITTGWTPTAYDMPTSTDASANGASFTLNGGASGGRYDLSISATWNAGSVALNLGGAQVFSWTTNTSLTATALLPGTYTLVYTGSPSGVAFSLTPAATGW